MSFTAGIACLLLAVGGGAATDEPTWSDEPATTELKPAPARATAAAMSFDALPEPPKASDDARVKRFLGALAGGVVGLGASMALMPLGDGSCFGGPCVSALHGLIGVFAPLLSVGGAWLAYEILGGDGGLLTPVLALPPAILIALGLLSVAGAQDANTALALAPFLVASGVFLAGGAALALDSRSRQLEGLGAAASWGKAGAGRVAVGSLVTAVATLGAAGFSVLLYAIGQYSALGFVLATAGALAGTFGAAAAAWGVHRGLDGRGSFGSALAGFGVAWLATFAGLGLYALSQSSGGFTFNPLRTTPGTLLFVELVVASATFLPVLALEWSHTNAVEAALPKFSFSAAPIPQGGMVAAAVRF